MAHARQQRRFRLVTGGAAIVAALMLAVPAGVAQASAGASSVAAASAVRTLRAVAMAPVLPAHSHVVGDVAPTMLVRGAVALRLRDPSALTRFLDETASPRSTKFHHFLGRGEFAARFGPLPASVAAVRTALHADGVLVTSVSLNHLLVSFRGDAAKVERAFHTGLVHVRLSDGTLGQATTGAARLPTALAGDVQAVVGLDQLTHEQSGPAVLSRRTRLASATQLPHTGSGGPVACADALGQQANGALTDQQVAASYGLDPLYGAGDLGTGQTIDVYELEPFLTSDVKGFDECFFGADHTSQLTVTPVDGGPGTGPGSGEAALDVEDVAGVAPGATIHVFSGPNMNDPYGPLDTWNAIAIADDARQVTSSWGLCETVLQEGAPGVQQVENEIFEQTAAQGQTIFASAGDDGSDDCANHGASAVSANLSVDDPGSQPYVTSVGGTTILNPTEPPVETVWNNGNDGGAGGGGISETWAMAPWQSSVAVPQSGTTQACSNDPSGDPDDFHVAGIGTTLSSGTPCREVPDVSALADPQTGITIEYAGQWFQIGGTSSATPLWAAMLAEINASSTCHGLTDGVGFADPLLYEVADVPAGYATAFNDVSIGNNDNLGVGGAVDWAAGIGYDLATGLGTPRVTNANGAPGLATQLCTLAAGGGATPPPAVSSLSKQAGGVGGGGSLTITGTNFGASQGSVFFGTVEANVTLWSTTSITVGIPGFSEPPNSQSGTGGSADVTVTTAGAPPQSSAPAGVAVSTTRSRRRTSPWSTTCRRRRGRPPVGTPWPSSGPGSPGPRPCTSVTSPGRASPCSATTSSPSRCPRATASAPSRRARASAPWP